jgi:hypothetical protein
MKKEVVMKETFNVMDLIKCPYYAIPKDNPEAYVILPKPLKDILFVSFNNLGFISGHVRVRGKAQGEYPFHHLEMIDYVFDTEENTIEVCSGSINGGCFTVDINPKTNPQIVDDAQTLAKIQNDTFSRWRCDPPYNENAAKKMYGTDLPKPIRLLEAGARVCKKQSLLFLLLGPTNYQWHPRGTRRIAYINMTVVPNNEVRCLNVFYKYANEFL